MRLRTIQLTEFKRFDDLTIDLGDNPRKLVVLVGPNGCGKSSVFDAFEEALKNYRNIGAETPDYYSKNFFYTNDDKRTCTYNRSDAVRITTNGPAITRKSFYIRTSYRFTSKLNVTHLKKIPDILNSRDEPISSIALDQRLQTNYERLLGVLYSEFQAGDKTGNQVREELLGKVNGILGNILDIELTGLGNIIDGNGQMYFTKGQSKDFPYANLSAGEKEVVDIILDLIVKVQEYNETVFCIDEPELHLNTAVQRKLLVEIEQLIPEDCQLWVATHSIGFLRAVQEELSEKAQVLDFSAADYFSGSKVIEPIRPTRTNWLRIFETALDDLVHLISPKRIVYCEGKDRPGAGNKERGFDAKVFTSIFGETHAETVFVSSGGNTELDQRSDIAIQILSKVFDELDILVLKDRDMASGRLTTEAERQTYLSNNPANHRVLRRWEIENYLFDKEVLTTYCAAEGLTFDETAYDGFVTDIENQNLKDSTARFRNFCGITTSINNEVFKLNLAGAITPEMTVYSELEGCIF